MSDELTRRDAEVQIEQVKDRAAAISKVLGIAVEPQLNVPVSGPLALVAHPTGWAFVNIEQLASLAARVAQLEADQEGRD